MNRQLRLGGKVVATVLGVLLAVAAALAWWLTPAPPAPSPTVGAPGRAGELAARIDASLRRTPAAVAWPRPAGSGAPALAVMPFTAPTGDTVLVAVADSMCEAITDHLGRSDLPSASACNSVRVARQIGIDAAQAAQLLGVRQVLSGTLEGEGDAVWVSARMVETAGGRELWHHRERHATRDLAQLPLRLVQRIAEQANRAEASASAAGAGAAEAVPQGEAYALVLQASFHQRRGGLDALHEARRLLDQALALAPDYAQAIFDSVALDSNLVALGVGSGAAVDAKVRTAAAQLQRIAPEHPLTAAMGASAAVAVKDWPRAWRLLQAAAERHPHNARLQHSRAGVLLMMGYLAQAGDAVLQAALMEPLAASVHERRARVASLLGDNTLMRDSAALTRELGRPAMAAPFEAWLALRRGDADQSELHWREMLASAKLPQDWVGPVMRAHLDPGGRAVAVAAIEAVPEEARARLNHLFLAYALAGETERAMAALRQLSDRPPTMWVSDLWLPELAALRRHAAFVPWLREMGLVALWDAHGEPERCRREAGSYRCE